MVVLRGHVDDARVPEFRKQGGEELVPVGKAYSGYTDQELVWLDRWIRNHTVSRFGPVREVEKSLVLEVIFDAAQLSNRHKSGVALRFPPQSISVGCGFAALGLLVTRRWMSRREMNGAQLGCSIRLSNASLTSSRPGCPSRTRCRAAGPGWPAPPARHHAPQPQAQ